ncbi:MAG: methionyl-tRNA formyltransferase [Verrucomicrobiaceae bacterium]
MRIVFMATGEIAESSLKAVVDSSHEVVGLVTQPDRPVGRKQVLTAPKVKSIAQGAGIPVIQPEKVRDPNALQQIRDWAPEVIVVMAYGQILPQKLIEIPERAIINLHASLLPKYRGASCIQGPLKEGDRMTGWSVIHVVKALDAGNVILQRAFEIGEMETGGELHDRLAKAAPTVLMEALTLLSQGEVPGEEQDEDSHTYVPKLNREDGRIDWGLPAVELERLVRAYDPWPGTFTTLDGKRLKIFPPTKVLSGVGEPGSYLGEVDGAIEIACGSGSLMLQLVQPDGKSRMAASSLARGKASALLEGFK